MQGERVWNSVESGWRTSLILDYEGRSTEELKPKHKWDKVDNEDSEANARVLFSIFNEVCPNEFHMMVNCKRSKEAWGILQVTHEGASALKISKLQMLSIKFENIRMHEN